MIIGLFGLCMPAFFLGLMMLMIFSVQLRVIPVVSVGAGKLETVDLTRIELWD